MRNIAATLVVTIMLSICAFGQIKDTKLKPDSIPSFHALSDIKEEALDPLRTLVPIQVPPLYSGPDAPQLPPTLNNATYPFFRPVFNQDGLSCGQAALVSYNYTYEVNRVRNLPGNVPANQYPTHFAWNWVNGGNGWYGASYFHSADMLRMVGTPNVTTYGGMSAGGGTRWMSGYDNYYQAMQNRIYDAYSINVSTIEGLQILKHYLHDHLEGSQYGGVASFYANHPSLNTLPPGTPEAGKKVVTQWSSANHAMTIVGYHDSIRWDYNGDGQYTNHLDINGDGIVDLRDWEIGGLLMVNSYGGVPNWGDGGFAYIMYKTLGEPYGGGGIWNQAVHVVKPKPTTSPQLTMKVKLKHDKRQMIKVTAGLSLDPNATSPSIEMDFPIFNYQGDARPMQGDFTDEAKTIEFGLDITPLLGYVPSGQTARYFLTVYEKDPNGQGTGDILAYSLIDYTNGVNEVICPNTPVALVNDGKTVLWINRAVNYNAVQITTQNLPGAKIYEPFTHQLEVAGGTPPYHWYLKMDYEESLSSQSFPMVNAQQLTPTNSTSGYATKKLDFSFPYYGELFDTLFIHVNGLILFDRQNYPWPYLNEPGILFKGYRNISPFNYDLRLYSGQGIWYEGNENYAIFRWKASLNGNQQTELNFAVKLYPNGNIEYYYGNMNYPSGIEWIGGLSKGDYRNFQLLSFTADPTIQTNKKVTLDAPDFVNEISLTTGGLLHGTPTNVYSNSLLKVMAVDNNNVFATKTLAFNTTGLLINYAMNSGGNNILEFGESASMDIIIKSLEPQTITNAQMTLSVDDPYITLINNTYQISYLLPGDSVVFNGAFSFNVSNLVPDNHPIDFHVNVTSANDNWSRHFCVHAYSPVVITTHTVVQDNGNGMLDPGETTNIAVYFKNNGGAALNNISILLTSPSSDVTVNNGQANIVTLQAGAGQFAIFNITIAENLSPGQVITLNAQVNGHNNYSTTCQISMVTGLIVENFESGNFNSFAWQFLGNQPWVIDSTNPYEGTYSARSGVIDHNQSSTLLISVVVSVSDSISFYRKVSSEAGYDYLKFYIDGVLMGQWAGNVPWSKVKYPISAGQHTLRWTYEKDYSVSTGSDCAWIDFIVFPAILSVNAGSNGLICEGESYQLLGSASNYSGVWWTSSGTGSFSNPNILNPVYTPSQQDIDTGSVVLTLTAQHASYSLSDDALLVITKMASAYAGPDEDVCMGSTFTPNFANANNFTSILWTTSGDGTFSHPAILNPVYTPGPNDLLAGSVILTINAYSGLPCPSASDELTLLFVQLPGKAFTPTGPDSVDLFVSTSSIYTTGILPQAMNYFWSLEPAGAGIITGSGNSATVEWNIAFTGYASIRVRAVNACGQGEYSDEKTTWVYDSMVDVPLIEAGTSISISPNPSEGLFRIAIVGQNIGQYSITVYNLIGNPVYHKEGLSLRSHELIEVNLENYPVGMYLLVLRSDNLTVQRKLIIGR